MRRYQRRIINLGFTDVELDYLRARAQEEGVSLSAYIRRVVLTQE